MDVILVHLPQLPQRSCRISTVCMYFKHSLHLQCTRHEIAFAVFFLVYVFSLLSVAEMHFALEMTVFYVGNRIELKMPRHTPTHPLWHEGLFGLRRAVIKLDTPWDMRLRAARSFLFPPI